MGLEKGKLLKKIKKLQQTADSYSDIGLEEAARLYAAKVQELLIQNKLNMADVDRAILAFEDPFGEEKGRNDDMTEGRRLLWAERFAGIISRSHFCNIILNTSEGSIIFVGRDSDREVAIYMFVYLSRVMINALTMERKKLKIAERAMFKAWKAGENLTVVNGDYKTKGFKLAFYTGFIDAIKARYEKQKEKYSSDTALIRANNEVKEWMASQFDLVPVRASKRRTHQNNLGKSLGNMHGQNANLSTQGVKSDCKQQGLIG